jgi:hypothetical protein
MVVHHFYHDISKNDFFPILGLELRALKLLEGALGLSPQPRVNICETLQIFFDLL